MNDPLQEVTRWKAKKRRFALIYLASGLIMIAFMGMLFIWPGVVAYLMALLQNPFDASGFLIGMLVMFFDMLLGGFIIYLIIALPIISSIGLFFIGIPSVVASWGLLTGRKWAPRVIYITGALYTVIFPIGTLLGIYAIKTMNKENRINQLK